MKKSLGAMSTLVSAAAAAVFLLGACSSGDAGQAAEEPAAAVAESPAAAVAESPAADTAAAEPLKFACILKDTSATFWKAVVAGCEQAAADLGVEVTILSGTTDMDIEGSVANFEDAITGGYAGIAIAPSDSVALVPTLEKAVAAGVPVVAMDTGFESDAALSTVASDSVAGAKAATVYLAEAIGGKGKVAMLACPLSISTCKDLATGFDEAIKAYPEITVVGKPLTNADRVLSFNAMQDILSAHPDLAGFFGISSAEGMGGMEAAEQAGKSVVGVSRNCALDELNSIESGKGLTACLAQFPKQMGYLAIKSLVDYNKGASILAKQDSGLLIIDKPRAKEFIDLGEFNGSPD